MDHGRTQPLRVNIHQLQYWQGVVQPEFFCSLECSTPASKNRLLTTNTSYWPLVSVQYFNYWPLRCWWFPFTSWKLSCFRHTILACNGDICIQSMHVLCTLRGQNCDKIWENPAYWSNIFGTMRIFSIPQAESAVFVIFVLKNLSTNLCLCLCHRVSVSHHFDLHSLSSCCTQSPLLRTLIRIHARRLSRYG